MVYLLPQVVSIIEENVPVAEVIEMKQMGIQVMLVIMYSKLIYRF
jgi:hypothetical protein